MPCIGRVLVGLLEEAARRAARLLADSRLLREVRDWATAFSLWPVHLTTSCCGAEFAAAYGPRYDLERMGSLPFTSPRNTNLMIVEGTLTIKMARAARIVWEQMPEPRFVIAIGACAFTGGVFYNSYNIVRVQDVLPVDVYVPGCPPRPEAIARAILVLQEKIRRHEYRRGVDVEDKSRLRELMEPVYREAEQWLRERRETLPRRP
ncbi:MAG: NADH-quinone oxidoreductase subunit B [Crenarchaeota archaeon]|nr:NADH-quinone oxidoreductase subunit B [Thermoproteota archaeon]